MTTQHKTAKVTIEIINEDGGKTIVTTELLDASKLPAFGRSRDRKDHIEIGMKDPFYDPDDWRQRKERWIDDLRSMPSTPSHFHLDLQLPPVKKTGPVYQIQTIDPPLTRLVMMYNPGSRRAQVVKWTEEEIQDRAEEYEGSIYFFLDIP